MEQSGFYVAVTNNSRLPLTKYEGVKIATGYATNIAIQKTYYYNLGPPYSDCREDVSTSTSQDSIYYKKTLEITTYSQKLCFEICLQYEYIIKVCGCADPSIPSTNLSQAVCHTISDIDCVTNVTNQFNTVDLTLTCGQYCPLECDSEEFAYWISMSNYPTVPYYNIISNQWNFNNKFSNNIPNGLGGGSGNGSSKSPSQSIFSESCALVNIYLYDMYYTEVDESPLLTIDGIFGIIGKSCHTYLRKKYFRLKIMFIF